MIICDIRAMRAEQSNCIKRNWSIWQCDTWRAMQKICVICLQTARYLAIGALYNKLTLLRTTLSVVAGQPVCIRNVSAPIKARVNALSDNHGLRWKARASRVDILPRVHLSCRQRPHRHRRFMCIALLSWYFTLDNRQAFWRDYPT